MRTFAPSYRNYRYSWKEMENSQNYCVILAGGRGRRLWPSSREACPKQFIDFFGTGRTQLQATYDRVIKMLPKENIYICTCKEYLDMAKQQLPEVPERNVMVEPIHRNTAPSVAWAAMRIHKKNPKANVLVLPSDQDLEGSSAAHIAKAAEEFPGVNFVAAHMDDPRTDACCRFCAEHPNLFTDLSGLFEAGYESDWDVLLPQYGGAVRAAGCESQILHGTDFCPLIGLNDIERFDGFLARIFTPEELENVYCHNALRAFPKLAAYLKEA